MGACRRTHSSRNGDEQRSRSKRLTSDTFEITVKLAGVEYKVSMPSQSARLLRHNTRTGHNAQRRAHSHIRHRSSNGAHISRLLRPHQYNMNMVKELAIVSVDNFSAHSHT